MKKIFIVFFALIILMIFPQTTEASKYNMVDKNIKLPNVTNSQVAKKIINGNFSYYGLKPGDSESKLIKTWGNSNTGWRYTDSQSGNKVRLYGKNLTVSVNTDTIILPNHSKKTVIKRITFTYPLKHEYSKIKKLYNIPNSVNNELNGVNSSVTYRAKNGQYGFVKKGNKYYLHTLSIY